MPVVWDSIQKQRPDAKFVYGMTFGEHILLLVKLSESSLGYFTHNGASHEWKISDPQSGKILPAERAGTLIGDVVFVSKQPIKDGFGSTTYTWGLRELKMNSVESAVISLEFEFEMENPFSTKPPTSDKEKERYQLSLHINWNEGRVVESHVRKKSGN